MALAPVASAAETVGPNVAEPTLNSGTCGYNNAANRPCVIIAIALPSGNVVSPCDGTITGFHLNGIPRAANHYRLRVMHRNPNGSFTGTATSAQVQIETDGVNDYATSLAIAKEDYLGIDFQDSTEDHGLRWVGPNEFLTESIFFAFPPDGEAAFESIPPEYSFYLFSADVACAGEGAGSGGGSGDNGRGEPPGKQKQKPDATTALFDGKALRIRLKCPARFKPRCLGTAQALSGAGRRTKAISSSASASQKAGKWKVVKLVVKPKYRQLVGEMAQQPHRKLLVVRQKLHAKGFKRGRTQAILHRYKVRSE